MIMKKNPAIYEINTRIWLRRFDTQEKKATLSDVPDSYWEDLREKGFAYIWLMGIWKTCESTIEKYCFDEELVQNYSKALKDWKKEDVIGSPYAIDVYEINPAIGSEEELLNLKLKLNIKEMKLILDFVPNHFSADTSLLKTNPEIFLSASEEFYEKDNYTFYKPFPNSDKIFAHGRDPFFPAWQDTLQINYFNHESREFMIKQLIKITRFADGVRCDMAMLSMNNVFRNTWGGVLSSLNVDSPQKEFWETAITIIKDLKKDFLFIGEAYWELEYDLQQMGFNYTYDKKLTDRLLAGYVPEIRSHLYAEYSYQKKSLRFIENHDEERAITSFGKNKSKAAAIIISTIQGMRFYYDGQFEGKKTRIPIQLGREPVEQPIECIQTFYSRLLTITSEIIFHEGKWMMRNPVSAWEHDESYNNILAWSWKYLDERRLVVVNYSDRFAQCRIFLDINEYPEQFVLTDLLTGKTYTRSTKEIMDQGLFIELGNYQSHIFAY